MNLREYTEGVNQLIDYEESIYFESMENIFKLEKEADAFIESVSYEDCDIDNFFEDGFADSVKSTASKVKEKIVKAIQFIIAELKKFKDMIVTKIKVMRANSKYKKAINALRGIKSNNLTMLLPDLPLVVSQSYKTAGKSIQILRPICSKFTAGTLTQTELEKAIATIEKLNNDFDYVVQRASENIKPVPLRVASDIIDKYADEYTSIPAIKAMSEEFDKISKEIDRASIDYYNKSKKRKNPNRASDTAILDLIRVLSSTIREQTSAATDLIENACEHVLVQATRYTMDNTAQDL